MRELPRATVAGLGACLALVAGAVDAICLAATGRFASHMTGTTTHVMADLVVARWDMVGLGASAVACFLCGAVLCGMFLASRSAEAVRGTLAIVNIVETAAILAGGMVLLYGPASAATVAMAIGLFAIAMGIQNTNSSHLLRPYRRTTHLTSTLTDLGAEIGVRLRATLGGTPAEPAASREKDVVSSSVAVLVCFCIGAGAGGIGMATIGALTAPLVATFLLLAMLLMLGLGGSVPAKTVRSAY